MIVPSETEVYHVTRELPTHLSAWELPPGWSWGAEGLMAQTRHYQEVIDALGRSLSLVSAPDPAHAPWLESEARHLAHRNHPAIPTTYHYWTSFKESRRGPGYLRRWLPGETLGSHLRRGGSDDTPTTLRIMREVGSALSYLHDSGGVHGAVSPEVVWMAPMARLWLMGWEWAVPAAEIPPGMRPDFRLMPVPNEWSGDAWLPTAASDQWQLAATCFASLTGELPQSAGVPPIHLLRPDTPQAVAAVIDRSLSADPAERFASVASMLRAMELLHPHIARDERAVSRFRREAKLAAQLAHPAIVPIYDWDSRGDVSWYTMELAEGGSVAELVARAGPRALAEIAPQVDFMLSGLAAAHAIGIVHRDLKPENILIDRYRRWRIADFGIAQAAGEERAGTSGTPAFAAPEQLLGEQQDAAVDCFSLAAIVGFALSGKAPFGDRDGRTILARELRGDIEIDLSVYPA
ncbi:MAG: hypothetical protein DMD26_13835, partial [Gemmatimonadetes bacterium]